MFERFLKAYVQGVLPQALLFVQPLSTDEANIQSLIAKMMGDKHSHPDYIVLKGASIKIDDIRQLQEKLMLTPYCARHYVVYFEHLETLTAGAMNALLKIVEEPSARVYFFATTHRVDLILPTVLSRFQKWYCSQGVYAAGYLDDRTEPAIQPLVTGWLQYMQNHISSYQLTEEWLKYPLKALGEALYCIVAEMIRLSAIMTGGADELFTLNQLIPMARKYRLLEKVQAMLKQLQNGIPLQGALFIETWLSWGEHA